MRCVRLLGLVLPVFFALAVTGCGEPVTVEKDPVKAEESIKMQAEMSKQERAGK